MTEDDARAKVCPFMSKDGIHMFCVASNCMLWAKMIKNGKKVYLNEEFLSVCYYNKESEKLTVEGYCGVLGKPPFMG